MSLQNKTILALTLSGIFIFATAATVSAQQASETGNISDPDAYLSASSYYITSGQNVNLYYQSGNESFDSSSGGGGVGDWAPMNASCSGNFPVSFNPQDGFFDFSGSPGSASSVQCQNDNGAGCLDWERQGPLYSGTDTVAPTQTTTYTFTCGNNIRYGDGGSSSQSVTINVAPACQSDYGSSCTSAPNVCGQTQTNGTYQCDGSCSSTPPSNSGCDSVSTPQLWGLYDNSTGTYYGSSAPDNHAPGYAMYANSSDYLGENVDYLFYFYNTQTGQYTTVQWTAWTGSGGWNDVTGLQSLPGGTYLVGAYAESSQGTWSAFSGWDTVTLYDVGCTSSANACGQTNSG